MAEVPQVYLNCAVYLYGNEFEASSGKAGGGTAFVIQIPLKEEGWFQCYVVTAAHIMKDDTVGEGPVVRINADDGGFQLIRTSHESWFIGEKDDLAIMPAEFQSKGLNVGVIPVEAFLTKEMIEQHSIGPGNEVFVTGRFVHHEGKAKNTPTVRFGNISMMPGEPFKRIWKRLSWWSFVLLADTAGHQSSCVSRHFICGIKRDCYTYGVRVLVCLVLI
jgi:hypothetical protein